MTHRSLEPYSLSIRLAATVEEVGAAARARHDAYAGLGLRTLDSLDPTTRLDVDVYDFWAHHLVMVLSGPQGEQVVGTMRVVMDEPSPQRELLLEALAPYPHLIARLHEQRPAPLPMMSYLTQADAVRKHYDAARASGLRVAEPGRLTVSVPARRFLARLGISAGAHFVRAACAYGFGVEGLGLVFVDCEPRLAELYRSHGFGDLTLPELQPVLGVEMLALAATADTMPSSLVDPIAHMTRQLRHAGEVRIDFGCRVLETAAA